MPDEEKTPEQIPWAERTKVTWLGNFVGLEHVWRPASGEGTKTTADVYGKDFEWSVTVDAKAEIRNYMSLDESLTNDIQAFWEEDKELHYSSSFRDRIMRWLRGGVERKTRKGPKEWSPRKKGRERVGKLTSEYGYGNTYNEDSSYWRGGEVFEYAHIETEDGEEGAVILWSRSGSPMGSYSLPEVWLGGFSEAMSMLEEGDPHSYETFLRWNENFENGFMWAWEKLGVFEDWDEHVTRLQDNQVRGVLKAIEKDPSILLPESVEKILENFEDFPKEIQKAVRWLMTNKRRELEKALGQKLLWEDIYGE